MDDVRKAITMHEAQQIRTFVRDLEDIQALRRDEPPSVGFLIDQDDAVRLAAWRAALDTAEGMVRANLRAIGVMA